MSAQDSQTDGTLRRVCGRPQGRDSLQRCGQGEGSSAKDGKAPWDYQEWRTATRTLFTPQGLKGRKECFLESGARTSNEAVVFGREMQLLTMC